MNTEINKYPFSEKSTLELNNLKYKLPLGLLLDASFTPACNNNPPFYVSDILKELNESKLIVKDNSGAEVFTIVIPHDQNECNYILGYGKQTDGSYCGSCVGALEFLDWLKAIPNITNIPVYSLVFSASVIFARGEESVTQSIGDVTYEGASIDSIEWGENLIDGEIKTNVIQLADDETPVISTIIINRETVTGEHIYITPKKDSAIRVVSSNEITIGKVLDL